MLCEAIYQNQAYVEQVHFRETRDHCGVGMKSSTFGFRSSTKVYTISYVFQQIRPNLSRNRFQNDFILKQF